MPAPVVIRDPTTYYEAHKDPSSVLGEDPVVPLRNFLAMQKADRVAQQSSTDESTQRQRNKHNTMKIDISMSPRLLGYVFSCISSAVGMISSTVFYARATTPATPETLEEYAESIGIQLDADALQWTKERLDDITQNYSFYFGSGGNLVLQWKVYGCIAVSGLLTVITLAIVIAHFDSVCCVKKNRVNFGDGSIFERNLILLLIIISVCALYISTSKFSVGQAQANVFFSTWMTFVSCAMNYEIWRKGSGKEHTFANVLFGQKRHWFYMSIFTTIAFLSTIDFFMNNNMIRDNHSFDCMDLSWTNVWVWFSMVAAVLCWIVVLLHRYCKWELCVRIVEAIVSLAIIGVDGYVVASFTGGRLDQVPCPSNLYFSVWGAFFLSVWIFSTLVVEGREGLGLE